jgi:probable rRNA maturation factor
MTLEFFDHQESHSVDVEELSQRATRALPHVLEVPGPEPSSLLADLNIEFSLVDDETIADVHGEFLDDPTPTDVITFHHGEILLSTDTAHRQSQEHGLGLLDELTLYAIHGLLHLHGHEDHSTAGAAAMKQHQERILALVLESR